MIDVRCATKRYRTVTAVDRVSFTATPGRVTALLGPNGAGKTSLLRMIVGITQPDEGTVQVHVDGRPARRRDLGYLPEERGLYKDVPVLRSLAFFGRLQGLSPAEATRAAGAWLERLGLEGRGKDKVDTLSRGNQQKVQLAAAILHQPRVAILDEPFSGLDPLNQDVFIGIIRELCEQGVTVLLSAHEMSLVERVADELVLVRHGQIALEGSVRELQRRFGAGDVYEIDFARPVAPDLLGGLEELVSAQQIAPTTLRLVVASRPLGEILAHLDVARVVGIRSEHVSLHDVYVRTVTDPSAAPTAAAQGVR